mgnify:FL=1
MSNGESNNTGDFQAIRNEIKAVVVQHGGKLHIEEWEYRGEECLRVLITWKRPINRPLEAIPAN